MVRSTIPHNETHSFPLGPEAECVAGAGAITIQEDLTITVLQFVDSPDAGNSSYQPGGGGTFAIASTAGSNTAPSGWCPPASSPTARSCNDSGRN